MLAIIEKSLQERKVSGDSLLDALDVVNDILVKGGKVLEEGYAILYHATTEENYEKILEERAMFGKEDGIFFSTKKDGEIKWYGDKILEVAIPVEKLVLDDEFEDEIHYKIKVVPYKKVKLNFVCGK